ncbi:hypothetical protein BaRGS_00037422, partial [Batillaria attramentaria]
MGVRKRLLVLAVLLLFVKSISEETRERGDNNVETQVFETDRFNLTPADETAETTGSTDRHQTPVKIPAETPDSKRKTFRSEIFEASEARSSETIQKTKDIGETKAKSKDCLGHSKVAEEKESMFLGEEKRNFPSQGESMADNARWPRLRRAVGGHDTGARSTVQTSAGTTSRSSTTPVTTTLTSTTRLPGFGAREMDLVFVLDASTSVTQPNFEQMKDFVKDFLSVGDIDNGYLRVGVVIYSTGVYVQFHLNTYTTRYQLLDAIDNIPYRYGSTNTADALKTVRTDMFTLGHGDRPGVQNVCILITDGVSNINSRRTIPEAEQARVAGIHIYAIGIGLTDTAELDGIASKPVEQYSFRFESYGDLMQFTYAFLSSLDNAPDTNEAEMDLVFVLDASTSVTARDFELMKDFVRDFVFMGDIDNGNVRVGVVVYSTEVHVQFNMNTYTTKFQLLDAIAEIPYHYGSTNTADALNIVRTDMFTLGHGDRPGVQNVCILITDGLSNINARRTIPEAEQAKAAGIRIYAIGIGLPDTAELDGIASTPVEENRFAVQGFTDLAQLTNKFSRVFDFCPMAPLIPRINCPPKLPLTEEGKGWLEWEGGESYSYCQWWIEVHRSLGVVLQFHVQLLLGDHAKTDDMVRVHYGDRIKTYTGDGPHEPLAITSDYVWFELITHRRNISELDDLGPIAERPVSRFNMSYTSYPRHTLPPEEESGVYNCSLPYIVPEEFQCDGIAQCLAGEDELDYNCRYTHLGCDEGWIAGDAFCLKVVFPENPISPDEAKIECLENHKADLGSLPHPGVRRLAANLMTKRGYDKLIVGLERVQNVTKGLGHLYRFLWRWTQAGMEFDGPHPHLTDSSQTCAILTFTNKLKSVDCLEQSLYGLVCARRNSQYAEASGRKRLRLRFPSSGKFRVPVRTCSSDHVVQPFHPCSTTEHLNTAPDSQIPLLPCKNGRRVHYTVTCDGFDDCGDMTDEENCKTLSSDQLGSSSYMCTDQAELVDLSYRCNGMPDCHDGSDEVGCTGCSKGTVRCGDLGCLPCGAAACSPKKT